MRARHTANRLEHPAPTPYKDVCSNTYVYDMRVYVYTPTQTSTRGGQCREGAGCGGHRGKRQVLVDVLLPTVSIPSSFIRTIDFIAHLMWRASIANVIKDEELSLRPYVNLKRDRPNSISSPAARCRNRESGYNSIEARVQT